MNLRRSTEEERRLAYDDVCHLLLVYKSEALEWEAAYIRLLAIHLALVKEIEQLKPLR